MSRPSNSGTATCIAASSGDSPASDAAQAAWEVVRHRPCSTGTSRVASAPTSQLSSPPALAVLAELPAPPAASTVTTRASTPASSSNSPVSAPRSEPQNTGSASAPAAVDRVAQRVDEAGVTRELMGPVVDDADQRPLPPGSRPGRTPKAGVICRRGEAFTGEQQGVGQEVVQLAKVVRAALGQVFEGLARDARGHGGGAHQLGVGRRLHLRARRADVRWPQRLQPARPALGAAEQPHDDDGGVADQGSATASGSTRDGFATRQSAALERAASSSVSAVDSSSMLTQEPRGLMQRKPKLGQVGGDAVTR